MTSFQRNVHTLPRSAWVILISLVFLGSLGAAVGIGVAIGRTQSATPGQRELSASTATSTNTGGAGMMGSGMGLGGAQTTFSTTNAAIEQQIWALTPAIQVNGSTNTIRYTTQQVNLVMVGAPPGHPGMYWLVDGRVNPTVVVPTGATITLLFVNGDQDTMHGWELTASGPPYSSMPMMAVAPTPANAIIMPVASPQGATWYGASLTFAASSTGVNYYLCPVPGHAEQGMWGKLIVS